MPPTVEENPLSLRGLYYISVISLCATIEYHF